MQPHLSSLPPEFKIVEDILNSDIERQKEFISNPVGIFHSVNIPLPESTGELLNKLTVFIEERVPIADPVTMIYE